MNKTDKLLNSFISKTEELFGKNSGVIVDPSTITIERFSTGSLSLDQCLKGGYPKGTAIEIFGDEQCGKTTLCIEGAEEFQKQYPKEHILWIDLENVFDNTYNSSIGLDTTANFILAKPKTGEDTWDLMVEFCKTFSGGLIVLDSISLLLPIKEDENSTGDANMALAARMNSLGLRKIMPHLGKNKTTLMCVNQMRSKIGVMYGDPNTTTGGNAWKFYARTRLRAYKSKGEAGVFSTHRVKTVKATYGVEGVDAQFNIVYGMGIDNVSEILDIAVESGVVYKAGSWFSYGDTKLGQGKVAVSELLNDNHELFEEIKSKL